MKVTVEIDQKWANVARSPLYFVVAALTGVSITFAPLFLYESGTGRLFPGHARVIVPLCFAVIYFVPFFYMRLGGAVIAELRRESK